MAQMERLWRACVALAARSWCVFAVREDHGTASRSSLTGVSPRRRRWQIIALLVTMALFSSDAAFAAETDCIGQSEDGRAVCAVPDVGAWAYGMCDEWAPYANRDAAWCAAYGGTYGGIYNGCSNTTITATESNLYSIAQSFTQNLYNSSCTGQDTSWDIPVSSNWCWSGSTTSQNGIPIGKFRRFTFTCTSGASETITAREDRPLACPPGIPSRTVNGQAVCVHPIPAKCNCGDGNPIVREVGQKIQIEDDGKFDGWTLTRRYASFGSMYAQGSALTTQSLGVRWRDSFDYRLQPMSGTSVVAALSFPTGSIQYFRTDGSSVLNTETSAYRLTATASGFDVIGDGMLLQFDSAGKLTKVSTAAGRTYTLTYSDGTASGSTGQVAQDGSGVQWGAAVAANQLIKVVSDTGRVLRYERDVPGKITQMRIGSGEPTRYFYSTNDLLNKVVYPGGYTRLYQYNESTQTAGANLPYALTGISDLDANGNAVRYASFSYDASGRATVTEHAGGIERYEIQLDPNSLQAAVTDPLGTQRTMSYATVQGVRKLTSESQPAGSGSAAATSSVAYDANGNKSSVDDPTGARTCRSYEPARSLETVRVEGLATTQPCAAVTTDGAALPTGSRKISTQWHPSWPMEIRKAEPGRITTSVYNGQPDPFNGNAIASCVPAGATLPNGQPIVVLCRRVEQATTDANGAQGFGAALRPDTPTRENKWTYNARGQVLTHDGPRTDVSDVTTFAYYNDATADHLPGDLQSVTNSVGQVTQYQLYDEEGRVKRSVAPNGIVTDIAYTPRGWVNSITLSAGAAAAQVTTYAYELDGRVATTTLPDGTTLSYSYDAGKRLTGITDGAGNTVTYTLDTAGNRIAEEYRDPGGSLRRQVTRMYDALGRVMSVTGAAQ